MNQEVLEWIGYIASAIVALSLSLNSILKFRWLNLIGSMVFSIYGLLIGALPVCILNFIIVIFDAYFLYKIYSKKEVIEIMEISVDDPYFRRFIEFNYTDIEKIFPNFSPMIITNPMSFLMLRNMEVSGVFIFSRDGLDSLLVHLDYVLPRYRDFKNGKFVFNEIRKRYSNQGIKKVFAQSRNSKHNKYLKKLGFKRISDDSYCLLFN